MEDTVDRTILHCDLNGFYAAVECLHRPELKNVPMAVCGDVEKRHGIILAKNELAKKFGVTTAETVWQAKTHSRNQDIHRGQVDCSSCWGLFCPFNLIHSSTFVVAMPSRKVTYRIISFMSNTM